MKFLFRAFVVDVNAGGVALCAGNLYNIPMMNNKGHVVAGVMPGSPADKMGLAAGDKIVLINGEPLLDEIDYQYLTNAESIELCVTRKEENIKLLCKKEEWEPLGISFCNSLLGAVRQCANECVFCFVDQMPPGLRSTLYVKDDDWRRSLIYGNYITLTNVGEREFERIIARGVSPLYISVHATNPGVRARMMGNSSAAEIMPRLRALRDAGLSFNAQLVICPGYNDGDILVETVRDLMALMPAVRSVAVVPVGLTKHREGLVDIEPFTKESAAELIKTLKPLQLECLRKFGTRLIFASDEFYCMSGMPLPLYDEYEDFAQIENGVGLLRQFEMEFREHMKETGAVDVTKPTAIACGVSFAPFLCGLLESSAAIKGKIDIVPVENAFFGPLVTVSGLLTGSDLIRALKGIRADNILISASMLCEAEKEGVVAQRFLDGLTTGEVEAEIGARLRPVGPEGDALADALKKYGG